ncbi:glycerophosphodiester phosphodiesterase family protein [Primorskyibacter sp. 2E107]|uniref:glycerophosphodiester phosphodiesterase family protein n=1 Tax=Primorskyibacter sp. 2E107 TaxID=3403458 RepID=UPI003AF94745
MTLLKRALQLGLILAGVGWLNNTSLLFDPDTGPGVRLLADRGVQQSVARDGPEADGCMAARIGPVTHGFIENTIPSMRAAFEAGASVVALDVHLTPDGRFVVFRDRRLECRTDGTGVTRAQPLAYLKGLDVGFGYTADGGHFPLRGTGVGLMPTLREVFDAELGGRYLIHFQSTRIEEGEALARMIERPEWRRQVWGVYGDAIPTRAAEASVRGLRGFDTARMADCLKLYALLGWTGHVPEACRDGIVAVPMDVAPYLWGWPHRFTWRMGKAGSAVVLLGPQDGNGFASGVETGDFWASVPDGFDGYVWTDRVEAVGAGLPRAELIGQR